MSLRDIFQRKYLQEVQEAQEALFHPGIKKINESGLKKDKLAIKTS